MKWKSIRLELARTPDFPQGSASRAYLLRVPVGEDGLIDAAAVAEDPGLATVRRFWPNEPDMRGHVIHTPLGWAFSYARGEADGEASCHLEAQCLLPGEEVTLAGTDGTRLPFRIASVRDLNWNWQRAAEAG